jgi:thiol-disulfide isomerase/thioredoxin
MRMKKFFPALFISFVFTALLIVQMSISGRKSDASKVETEKTKYGAFESVFQKLEVKTTKGTKIKFKEVKQPIVLINFWASWCMPCISEFSSLTKFVDMFPKDQVLVVGINNDDENPLKAIKKTEKNHNLNFESYSDNDSSLTASFFISKIPATIVYHKGKVVFFSNEETNFIAEDFVVKIKKLLN